MFKVSWWNFLLQQIGPSSLQLIRNLLTKLESNQVNILRFIACSEIFLMPTIIFLLFTWVCSPLVFIILLKLIKYFLISECLVTIEGYHLEGMLENNIACLLILARLFCFKRITFTVQFMLIELTQTFDPEYIWPTQNSQQTQFCQPPCLTLWSGKYWYSSLTTYWLYKSSLPKG